MSQGKIDIQKILDGIAYLNQVREKLLSEALSPVGAYVHEYTVYRKYPSGFIAEYRYAKWQADKPIFKRNPKTRALPPKRDKDPKFTNHQHIGRVSSNTGLGMEPEVEEAYRSVSVRTQLEAVEQALREIQSILSRFEPK
jgi:hypothetical protein